MSSIQRPSHVSFEDMRQAVIVPYGAIQQLRSLSKLTKNPSRNTIREPESPKNLACDGQTYIVRPQAVIEGDEDVYGPALYSVHFGE